MMPNRAWIETVAFAGALFALASCVAGEPEVPAETELESLPTDALNWVAPISSGEHVAVDEPLDLTVYTQHPDARVVHFLVDGAEVDLCDPADTDDACHQDQQWTVATTFDAPGRHTLTATFTTASGATVSTTPLDVFVVAESELPAERDGDLPDPDMPDPAVQAEAENEGIGRVVGAVVGPRGVLDPNRPQLPGVCQRANVSHCSDSAAPAACLRWGVTDGRVRLARGHIDGSRSRIDRCMQEHYASILRYADVDAVSRASVAAWLSASGNCDPRRAWHGNLLTRARCAAAWRATHRGEARITGRDCVARVRQSADLGIELATQFVESQRRRHHKNPVLVAALVSGGLHTQSPRANHWCLGSGPGSEDFIDRFVAEYNAYREWERGLRLHSIGGVALSTTMRVGTHLESDDIAGCPPAAGATPSPACAALLDGGFNRHTVTAGGVFWSTVHRKGAGACPDGPHTVAGANGECFDYSRFDAAVDFARATSRPLDVNTLLYPSPPDWLTQEVSGASVAARRQRLHDAAAEFLTRTICRYTASAACNASPFCTGGGCAYIPADQFHPVETWTLFNEVTDSAGTAVQTPENIELRFVGPIFSPFGETFPAFMLEMYDLAIRLAPDAVLMINENVAEGLGAPAGNYLTLVRYLLSRGAPLHAVGLQAHVTANPANARYVPSSSFAANLAAFSAAHIDQETQRPFRLHPSFDGVPGVRVRITELGVRRNENREGPDAAHSAITSTATEEVQARYLYDLVSACRDAPRCDSVTWWAVGDGRSWDNCFRARITPPDGARVGEIDHAELFDERYCPKRTMMPAFTAALQHAAFPTAFPDIPCAQPPLACICCPRGGGVPTCAPAGTPLVCSHCDSVGYTTTPPAGAMCAPVFSAP